MNQSGRGNSLKCISYPNREMRLIFLRKLSDRLHYLSDSNLSQNALTFSEMEDLSHL